MQRWGWFGHQTSGGHEESKTNEEGRQDGQQAVPEIWDYVEQDKKQQRNQPDEDDEEELTCIARSTCGFLSITGQGMSAWMMQSMLNSTSDKIKKEYTNEMMKQQILKICHDNAKMMKELTEMKSLLSSSPTPPVNDIFCKSTNVKILSAPSLPTPYNENEKDKEEANDGEEDIYT